MPTPTIQRTILIAILLVARGVPAAPPGMISYEWAWFCDPIGWTEAFADACTFNYPETTQAFSSALAVWKSRNEAAAAKFIERCATEMRKELPDDGQRAKAFEELGGLRVEAIAYMRKSHPGSHKDCDVLRVRIESGKSDLELLSILK